MGKWLASGLRRDVCVVVYDQGTPTAQDVKSAIQAHYDERIPPNRFYGALDTLVEKGYLEERVDGIHDRYALTEAGKARLEEHVAWITELVGEE
jgi:DNA-binding PadR family transcriptional regulator